MDKHTPRSRDCIAPSKMLQLCVIVQQSTAPRCTAHAAPRRAPPADTCFCDFEVGGRCFGTATSVGTSTLCSSNFKGGACAGCPICRFRGDRQCVLTEHTMCSNGANAIKIDPPVPIEICAWLCEIDPFCSGGLLQFVLHGHCPLLVAFGSDFPHHRRRQAISRAIASCLWAPKRRTLVASTPEAPGPRRLIAAPSWESKWS